MAASIALKDTTTARGAGNYLSGTGFYAGRIVPLYVNGNYAGCTVSGPYGHLPSGNLATTMLIPAATPTGAAKPVVAEDNTDQTDRANTTVTVS